MYSENNVQLNDYQNISLKSMLPLYQNHQKSRLVLHFVLFGAATGKVLLRLLMLSMIAPSLQLLISFARL